MLNKLPSYWLLFLLWTPYTFSQQDSTHKTEVGFNSEIGLGSATGPQTPLWIRANQYGIIPLDPHFGIAKVGGSLSKRSINNKFQWYSEIEVASVIGKTTRLILPVAFTSFRYGNIEVYVGRKKEIYGLVDTLNTSGSYAWSGNSLPIPKIQIGTAGFVPIHFTHDFLSIQATFAHGWFGKEDFAYNYFLHQKTFYLRLGKPKQKLKFYGGISHFAQWGGNAPLLIGLGRTGADGSLPKSINDFWYILTAKNFPQAPNLSQFDSDNRLGNHLGTIDLGFTYKAKNSTWMFYTQHSVENAPGLMSNFPDGLYGLSWSNNKTTSQTLLKVRNITLEALTLLDQGVFIDSRYGYLINDYFNNSQYMDGWSYRNNIIGNPLITLRTDTRPEWFNSRGFYSNRDYHQINGNYMQSLYLAVNASWKNNTQFKFRSSISHYLLYLGEGKFGNASRQFSGSFEVFRKVKLLNNSTLHTSISFDSGKWLPNTFGFFIGIKTNLKKSK